MITTWAEVPQWRRVAVLLASLCAALGCGGILAASAHASATIFSALDYGAGPAGVAIDSAGDIYTANGATSKVSKITPEGVRTTLPIAFGLSPQGIALDSAGNIYTANFDSNNVTKITPGGSASVLAGLAGGRGPAGIAVDSAGNVYTANSGSNNLTKITPEGTPSLIDIAGGLSPRGVTLDSAGNIYTANTGSNNVTKITPAGAASIIGLAGVTLPRSIAVDSLDNVYTANFGTNDVTKITLGGTPSILGDTDTGTRAISVDSAGNIYTVNTISNNVSKITPGGVSSVLSDLAGGTAPAALTLDSAGDIYTANFTSNNVTKVTPTLTNGTPDIFPAPPAPPSAPSAAADSPGSGSATVVAAGNPISAAFGTPSSYTITAVQNASKQCVVTSPNTSCSVTGLTAGTAYTFTARANLNSWQTAASTASNSVIPAAVVPDPTPSPTPAKPAVAWSSSAKARTVSAVITPVVGVTYTFTAKSGRTIKKGTCKNVTIKLGKAKLARRSCTLKLTQGKWVAAVTPTQRSVNGPASSKTYTFK